MDLFYRRDKSETEDTGDTRTKLWRRMVDLWGQFHTDNTGAFSKKHWGMQAIKVMIRTPLVNGDIKKTINHQMLKYTGEVGQIAVS